MHTVVIKSSAYEGLKLKIIKEGQIKWDKYLNNLINLEASEESL